MVVSLLQVSWQLLCLRRPPMGQADGSVPAVRGSLGMAVFPQSPEDAIPILENPWEGKGEFADPLIPAVLSWRGFTEFMIPLLTQNQETTWL